ncbi:DUF5672 family protein [Mangrovibacterium sp.]|uniref:DUF5672 family protein n=1 Tax=Mangrovibacterium sp. TaxID=1961364 RepID=UPI00356573BE
MTTNNKNVCVIIPVYQEMKDLELYSFKRMVSVFSSRKIVIIGPPSLEDYIHGLCATIENSSSIFFENVFGRGPQYYSRLFMSNELYKHFLDFDYVVVCQTDVFVIKDDIDYWCEQGYDMIGAPVFEGYTAPKNEMKQNALNTGFCIRNPKSCYKVLSMTKNRYSKISSLWKMESIWYWKFFRVIRDGLIFNYKIESLRPIINEDMFWTVLVPDKFPWFKNCPPEKAKYFSYDANPRYLFQESNNTYPMAIHAWWRYDKPFVMEIIESLDDCNIPKGNLVPDAEREREMKYNPRPHLKEGC